MTQIAARLIDAGVLDPVDLHATYMGLAEAQAPSVSPILLVARSSRAHLSIGASQAVSADIDMARCRESGLDVVQRPLGGGSVWVDPAQTVVAVILPRDLAPGRPTALFDACLYPMLEVFGRFGLTAMRVGEQDIWVGGRKILGSGAATIGSSMVFATSILRQFDAAGFAAAIRAPSDGFREWLQEALAEGMTDWQAAGIVPDDADLVATLSEVFGAGFGWGIEPGEISGREREAIRAAACEIEDERVTEGPRHVRHGTKINQRTYLLEEGAGPGAMRLLIDSGRIVRAWAAEAGLSQALQAVVKQPVDRFRLEECLAKAGLDPALVSHVIERVLQMTADIPLQDAG